MKSKAEKDYLFSLYEEKKEKLIRNHNVPLEVVELFENSNIFKNKKITNENYGEIIDDSEAIEKSGVTSDELAIELETMPVRLLSEVVELCKEINS